MMQDDQRYDLFLGDCLEYMKSISDHCVPMLLTDIPYGEVNKPVDYGFGGIIHQTKGKADEVNFDLASLIHEFARVTATDGTMCVFCGTLQVSTILTIMQEEGFSTRILILEKTNPFPANPRSMMLSGVEVAAWGKRKGATFNGHCVNNVFRYPTSKAEFHPTEKPLGLFTELVKLSTNPGDIVFDPMMGSGTAGIAALSTGRRFVGCEIDTEYYYTAKDRIEEAANTTNQKDDSTIFCKTKSSAIRYEKWKRIQKLFSEGYSKSKIVSDTGLSWKTVDKLLSMTETEFLTSGSYHRDYNKLLDSYSSIIADMFKREPLLSSAQIYRRLKQLYPDLKVSSKTVFNFVSSIRKG